ncbi:hypothetical protein LAT59_04740 [Candidatus Gracilibacteria bacterium]|nr:hypothetical protein [Candidatus Gracilibacteria bacterium]
MKYTFKSLKQVSDIFVGDEKIGATEISNRLGKSRTIVHKYLKELLERGELKKIGTGPQVVYQKINFDTKDTDTLTASDQDLIISFQDRKILDEFFLKFSAEGLIMKGFEGFKLWCLERGINTEEKIKLFIKTYHHIVSLQDSCGLISAKNAFGKDFETVYLDNIFYADQYNWMEFGRGKLAELTFYGKSTQNKDLINQSIEEIFSKLECKIKTEKYDAIAITPWSIDRKNQLLKILEIQLKKLNLPFVNIIKYSSSGITIPQKSLKTREQRIKNAKNTIFVDERNIGKYKKVFLIDDFVGSGSTLNETAKKLKDEGVSRVDGFAFVGNLNLKYDIINEV